METLLDKFPLTEEVSNVLVTFTGLDPGMSRNMWVISSTWMHEVHSVLKTTNASNMLAMYLLNNYTSDIHVPDEENQKYLCASMYIAEQLQDGYHPDIDDYVYMAMGAFTLEELRYAINKMIVQFEGKIIPITVTLCIYSIIYEEPTYSDTLGLATRIATVLCMYAPQFIALQPWVFACGCISMVKRLTKKKHVMYPLEKHILYHLQEAVPFVNGALKKELDILGLPGLLARMPHTHNGLPHKVSTRSPEKIPPERGYEFLYELGEGGYGNVSLFMKNGTFVARKTQESGESAFRELAILATYAHPNLIHMDGFSLSRTDLTLDLEPAVPLDDIAVISLDIPDLWNKVYIDCARIDTPLSHTQKRKFQRDIILGLEYLHHHGIIHRDLKLANILVVNNVAKITDFGLSYWGCLSKQDKRKKDMHVYTIMNRPLELLYKPEESRAYAFETDIWALATVLLEIENGYRPFHYEIGDYNAVDSVLYHICRVLGTPQTGKYDDFLAVYPDFDFPGTGLRCIKNSRLRVLLLQMFNYEPNLRPTITDALESFDRI